MSRVLENMTSEERIRFEEKEYDWKGYKIALFDMQKIVTKRKGIICSLCQPWIEQEVMVLN